MPQSVRKKSSRKKKPQKYDSTLKDWIEQQASEILPVLLPGTIYEKTLNVEVIRSPMRSDKVFQVLYNGTEHVLHLEFETGSDGDLRSRLLVYNSVLYRDHKLPVITVVVYPFPLEPAKSPLCIKSNEDEILTFHFRTLPLFTMEAEQFVQEHRACMYPLLPAMQGVHAELIEQVMQELTELYCENEYSLSQQFEWMRILLERSGTISPLEKVRIEERLSMFDKLWDESPRVQQMKKQFREDARKEAEQERVKLRQETEQERVKWQQEMEKRLQREMEKRLQQEMEKRLQQEMVKTDQEVKTRRNSLILVTRTRFPSLADFVQQQVELFDRPEVLDLLMQQIATAPDANTARLLLNAGRKAHE